MATTPILCNPSIPTSAASIDSVLAALSPLVPQTYAEAVGVWGKVVAGIPSHEWDNRTTWENVVWLLRVHAMAAK